MTRRDVIGTMGAVFLGNALPRSKEQASVMVAENDVQRTSLIEVAIDCAPAVVSASVSASVIPQLEETFADVRYSVSGDSIGSMLAAASINHRRLRSYLKRLNPNDAVFRDHRQRLVHALDVATFQIDRIRHAWDLGLAFELTSVGDNEWPENVARDWQVLGVALAEVELLVKEYSTTASYGAYLNADGRQSADDVYAANILLRSLCEEARKLSLRKTQEKFAPLSGVFREATSKVPTPEQLTKMKAALPARFPSGDADATSIYILFLEALRDPQASPLPDSDLPPPAPSRHALASVYSTARTSIHDSYGADPGFWLPVKIGGIHVFARSWSATRRVEAYNGALCGFNPKRLKYQELRRTRAAAVNALIHAIHG